MHSEIDRYNQTVANQPTPAGKVLVGSGLFTIAQLRTLKGVAPAIALPPPGQVGMGPLHTFDVALSWTRTVRERLRIEPRVSLFNVLNVTNFDLPPNVLTGLLNGSAGSINGTVPSNRVANRVGVGTGTFALGSPRAIEFGMTVSF